MILFLYGEDNFRSLKKLKEIIAHYRKIHQESFNLKYFDFQKDEFEEFRDEFQTKSIFKEQKFFVIKNAFSNLDFKKKFLRNKKEFLGAGQNILFYERGLINQKDPLFIFLKKNSKFQRFDYFKKEKLKNWIKKEFEKYNKKIGMPVLNLLIEFSGNNLWQTSNEIQKLVSYKAKSKIIAKEDVELLVVQKIEPKIFTTIDLIAKKQKGEAITLTHQHLKNGDSPLYLLSMIAFQFRNLLVLKQRILTKKSVWNLGWHPFLIKKTLQLSSQFSFEELKKIYQKIVKMDLEIKTGRIEPELALDLLIAQI